MVGVGPQNHPLQRHDRVLDSLTLFIRERETLNLWHDYLGADGQQPARRDGEKHNRHESWERHESLSRSLRSVLEWLSSNPFIAFNSIDATISASRSAEVSFSRLSSTS